MNKTEQNDHLSKVLHAIEHPEDYSDEQLRGLLNDEECADYYRLMCDAASAYASTREETEKEVDEAWQQFSARHLQQKSLWRKIAAIFVGTVLLSGVAYAAITYISQNGRDAAPAPEVQAETPAKVPPQEATPADTAYIFKDAELQEILTEVAAYYQLQAQFNSDQSRHTRLYIKWNQTEDARSIVDRLNKFEKVNITLTGDLIIAE